MRRKGLLVHLTNELVDVLLTVAVVTTLDKLLELASAPATGRVLQLERPEEGGCPLEVCAENDQILTTGELPIFPWNRRQRQKCNMGVKVLAAMIVMGKRE
jgi:hypothetical protein